MALTICGKKSEVGAFVSYGHISSLNFLHIHIEKICVHNFSHSFQLNPMKLSMHNPNEE